MQTYIIPKNAGKFTAMVVSGGHFAVWNGKQGKQKGEIRIPVKTLKEARALADRLNRGEHDGTVTA
jgi:hypothetical protein